MRTRRGLPWIPFLYNTMISCRSCISNDALHTYVANCSWCYLNLAVSELHQHIQRKTDDITGTVYASEWLLSCSFNTTQTIYRKCFKGCSDHSEVPEWLLWFDRCWTVLEWRLPCVLIVARYIYSWIWLCNECNGVTVWPLLSVVCTCRGLARHGMR